MIEPETLDILEFDKIRSSLVDKSYTPAGKKYAGAITPMIDIEALNHRLDETTEMTEILRFEEPFPLERIDDTKKLLHLVSTEGTYLDPKNLLKLKTFLEICARLKKYIKNKSVKYPLIASYLCELKLAQNITSAIDSAVDKTGEIRDSASPALRRIRIEKSSTRNKILSKLEKIIRSRRQIGTRQDDLVTIRDGRYVIPVSETEFSSESGVVHDRSKSGATLYVEPMVTVEANNRLRKLDSEEESEIERILISIADLIRDALADLQNNYRIVSSIDFIHARGLLSIQLEANRPTIVLESRIKLINARHPLLLMQTEKHEDIKPMSVSLGGKFDALIVTGPNTGGKTVALKCLGLLALMARSGLHIPADKKSEIGSIHSIFADIGDEQSIELSLSTFSSHLSRVIHALENCDEYSLVLLDEIGAGTDPKEGAALAEAVLSYLLNRNAMAFVTTHYSALKTLPEKYPRIENASLEFDYTTLKPTYRFKIGFPGSSYAIEIARRLGMPAAIIERAENLVGTQERSLTNLLEKLEVELEKLRKEKRSLVDQKSSLEAKRKKLREQESDIGKRRKELERKELEETQYLVEQTRQELERLVKEIREKQAHKTTVKHVHEKLRKLENRLEEKKRRLAPKKRRKSEKLKPGDTVWVETLQADGELLEYLENSRSWKVRVGNMISTVQTKFLSKMSSEDSRPKLPVGVNYAPFDEVSSQISVIGMTVEEALEAVEKFIDSVSLSNLDTVYILHGKGTGALRSAIKKYLSKHPLVSDLRLGYVSEGSSGVTVVTLKRN